MCACNIYRLFALEMPLLKSFYEKARPMRDDFEILAVSTDEYADAATGAANGMRLPFPVLVGGEKVAEAYVCATNSEKSRQG